MTYHHEILTGKILIFTPMFDFQFLDHTLIQLIMHYLSLYQVVMWYRLYKMQLEVDTSDTQR